MKICKNDVFIYVSKGSLPSNYNNLECEVLGIVNRNNFIVYFKKLNEAGVVNIEELKLFKRKKEIRIYNEIDPYGEEDYSEDDDYELVKREDVFKKNKILRFFDFLNSKKDIVVNAEINKITF